MKVYSVAFLAGVGWGLGLYASRVIIEMIEDLPETDFWQHKVLKVEDSSSKEPKTIGFAVSE